MENYDHLSGFLEKKHNVWKNIKFYSMSVCQNQTII